MTAETSDVFKKGLDEFFGGKKKVYDIYHRDFYKAHVRSGPFPILEDPSFLEQEKNHHVKSVKKGRDYAGYSVVFDKGRPHVLFLSDHLGDTYYSFTDKYFLVRRILTGGSQPLKYETLYVKR